MSDAFKTGSASVEHKQHSRAISEALVGSARATAVFGPPVTQGEHTVITAAEIVVAMGEGYGFGGAKGRRDGTPKSGDGGGGGGGGYAKARPVAAISIGPKGVTVHPIRDRVRLAMVVLGAAGGILAGIRALR